MERQLWARGNCEQAPQLEVLERHIPRLAKNETDGWREANQFRHKLFEGPRKPEPDPRVRELKKKREELARVVARLQDPDVSPGIVKELRKHVVILEREIAELVARTLCRRRLLTG